MLCCTAWLSLPAASSSNADAGVWSMRWRIWANPDWGISFRYPYDYYIPDQYAPALQRERKSSWSASIGPDDEVTSAEDARRLLEERLEAAKNEWDVRAFSVLAREVPNSRGAALSDLASAVIESEFDKQLSFEDWQYYAESEQRPHVHPKWAPRGILAVRGEGDEHCAMVLRHDDRISGVIFTGGLSEHENAAIMDTLEVMKKQRRDLVTFRESQWLRGRVLGPGNAIIPANRWDRKESVRWPQAFEVETAHYHVMVQTSPERALHFARFLEGLYQMFIGLYQPEQVPHFKQEIHIFDTQREFAQASSAHGIPVGGGTLGFFVPRLLSIFAYEDSINLGMDASVESTLAHECSHQFLHAACNGSDHVPTWVNEGIAVYFESAKFDEKRNSFSWRAPETRLTYLKGYYAQGGNRMLWDIDNYIKHYGHIPGANYAEVYAITHFLVFGAGRTGREKFQDYWSKLREGADGTEAFETVFMQDLIKKYGSRSRALEVMSEGVVQHVMKGNASRQ